MKSSDYPESNISQLIRSFKSTQEELRKRIKITKPQNPIKFIAGCDSAFFEDKIISVFVIFDLETLNEVEVQYDYSKVTFPYISGYLSFREMPNLIKTYKKLKTKPDLIMVDGNGIIHPRRMGIAAHLGLELETPTFGVAKNRLVGTNEIPNETKGSFTYVKDKNEIIGIALSSKDKIKPIYISTGHMCDLETALDLTLKTLRKHKLPEPTRIADKYSKEFKKFIR